MAEVGIPPPKLMSVGLAIGESIRTELGMSDPVWSRLAEEVVMRLLRERSGEWMPQIRSQAEYLSAIFIGCDLETVNFLGVNGQVFVLGEDDGHPGAITVHTERRHVLGHLVWGSKRYPELKALLPIREPGSIDCMCLVIPVFAERKVICHLCGGMGWLPPEQA